MKIKAFIDIFIRHRALFWQGLSAQMRISSSQLMPV